MLKNCHRDVKCRRNRQNIARKQGKSRPGDEKTIKSYPGEGKALIFHSALLVKKWYFSKKILRFGAPWEMWILKLFRRHQFFEAMLILTVPGLRNIIFEEKGFFGKYFSKILSRTIFFGTYFFKKNVKTTFPENGVGGNFGFGGRARKITPLIYPLIFKNLLGHETGRRKSFLSFSTTDRRNFSRWCRIWNQKWRD